MRIQASLVVIGASLSGCGGLSDINGVAYAPHAGQTRWLKMETSVCSQPGQDCVTVREGAFVPDRKKFSLNIPYCHVQFLKGPEGYIDCTDVEYSDAQDPKIAAREAQFTCDRKGQPKVGMSEQEAVLTCWGRPFRINRTLSGSHTFVQYVYTHPSNRYLYFSDGRLTSIQESSIVGR